MEEIPEGRAQVIIPDEQRSLSGPLAAISDFILSISDLTTLLGALSSGALLGYTIAQHAESLKEITELPILNFRSTYTPAAAYELFQALGPEGRAEYQYLNVLSTGAFPMLVAIFLAICIGKVFSRAKLGSEWNLFPFLFVLASLVENALIGYMLWVYPEVHINAAAVSGMIASMKIRFFWYSVLTLVFGLVWLAKNEVQERYFKKQQ